MTRTARSHEKTAQALEVALRQMRHALIQTVHAVSAVASRSDRYTAVHQERVAVLAVAIGRKLGLEEERLEGLYLGALVHDIGKIAVPAELISKPDKLTAEEFALVKTHVRAGVDMLKDLSLPWPVQGIIGQHHERLDGSGYPSGLTGSALLIEARITAVADVFEAICEPRPYRPARGAAEALAEIARGAGVAYDAEAAGALASLLREAGSEDFWTHIDSADFSSTVILAQPQPAHPASSHAPGCATSDPGPRKP
jgi:putative nucleotidyltransferase with HDIG domain